MARFCGMIGFSTSSNESEDEPSVYTEDIYEKKYTGIILQEYDNHSNKTTINTDIHLGHRFSIIMDPYASQNVHNLRYIEYMGTRWTITSVEIKYPRLIISIGEVWRG